MAELPAPYYHDPAAGITLYHADCRQIMPHLEAPPALILTDPPYGIGHDTDYTRFTGGAAPSATHLEIAGDAEPFDPAPLLALGAGALILWGANCYSGLPPGALLIWDKRSPGGAKNVMADAEAAWFSRGRGVYIYSHSWDGFNRASERGTAYHPSQKPVARWRWCIARARLPAGSLIFDPYAGAGPVAVAAKELGMRYVGCEVHRPYLEIAASRLAQEIMPLEAPA